MGAASVPKPCMDLATSEIIAPLQWKGPTEVVACIHANYGSIFISKIGLYLNTSVENIIDMIFIKVLQNM